MLESEQTLIPAFPRGPDGRRVRPRADRRRADGTDDTPRREHRGRPGAKAYAVAAACHASSRRKPCISHSGTFAIPLPRPRIGSQLSGVARPWRAAPAGTASPGVPPAGAKFRQAKQHHRRLGVRGFGRSAAGEFGHAALRLQLDSSTRGGALPARTAGVPTRRTPACCRKRRPAFIPRKLGTRRQRGCNCRPTTTVLFRRAPGALLGEERDWRPTCISSPVLRH
jgi:hypothetical protein